MCRMCKPVALQVMRDAPSGLTLPRAVYSCAALFMLFRLLLFHNMLLFFFVFMSVYSSLLT